jgi:hypothetical protein
MKNYKRPKRGGGIIQEFMTTNDKTLDVDGSIDKWGKIKQALLSDKATKDQIAFLVDLVYFAGFTKDKRSQILNKLNNTSQPQWSGSYIGSIPDESIAYIVADYKMNNIPDEKGKYIKSIFERDPTLIYSQDYINNRKKTGGDLVKRELKKYDIKDY